MPPAAQVEIDYREASTEQLQEALWRAGDLSWRLHADQHRVYRQYREWAAKPTTGDSTGQLQRVFVFDIGRRYGKTWLSLVLAIEQCLRHPGASVAFACAKATDIGDIVRKLVSEICDSCPYDLKPQYRTTRQGASQGYYFPENGPARGSVLQLIGLDVDPDGLRGRGLDGIFISEAGFVRDLKSTIVNVLYPQLQGRPHARILLESSAPVDPAADFDTFFVPDAKVRGAHVFRTIFDNPLLSEAERSEFILAAGGLESPQCKREYLGIRSRDTESTVVPEFDQKLHVQSVPVPAYADCYVSLDPAQKDLCAILFGFWDFENARLVIQRDWAETNASTRKMADTIKTIEAELWTDLKRWNGKDFKPNPKLRVSDTDPRLLNDFYNEHGLTVRQVQKANNGVQRELKEAAVHSMRGAMGRGQIVIDPGCTVLIDHLNGATWNDNRTDYRRHAVHKHWDAVDALVIMWRSVQRNSNANPPSYVGRPHDSVAAAPELRDRSITNAAKALEMVFGSGQGKNASPNAKRTTWQRPKNSGWKRRR